MLTTQTSAIRFNLHHVVSGSNRARVFYALQGSVRSRVMFGKEPNHEAPSSVELCEKDNGTELLSIFGDLAQVDEYGDCRVSIPEGNALYAAALQTASVRLQAKQTKERAKAAQFWHE